MKKLMLYLAFLLLPIVAMAQWPIGVRTTNGSSFNWTNRSVTTMQATVDWSAGNVTYVPLGSNIQTYVNAAVAGDTLILASGRYDLGSNVITINKQLNLVGQGHSGFVTTPVTPSHGTILTSSSNNITAIKISSSNVRVSDLSINLSGNASTAISAGTNLVGIIYQTMDVIVACTTGIAQGFVVTGSDAILRDLTFYVTSGNAGAVGLYFINDAACTNNNTCEAFNVTGTVRGGADWAYCFDCEGWGSLKTNTLNLDVCRGITLSGTPNDTAVAAITSAGADRCIVNAYHCTFDGADKDVYQSGSNQMNLGGSVIANNLVTGTITYRAVMIANSVVGTTVQATDATTLRLHVTTNNWVLTNAVVTVNGVINGDGSGITNLNTFWHTNPVAASSISNTYNQKTTGSVIAGSVTAGSFTLNSAGLYLKTPGGYISSSANLFNFLDAGLGRNSTVVAGNFVSTNTITATNGLVLPTATSYITFTAGVLTNPPVAGAANAYIFAGTNSIGTNAAELFVMDGYGSTTQISPHANDAPESLLDLTDEYPMVSKESNLYLGHARWINQSREARRVEQLLHAVQVLIGMVNTNGLNALQLARLKAISSLTPAQKDIVSVQTNYTPRLSWAAVQAGIQTRYANSYTNAMDNFNIAWDEYLQAIIAGDTNAVAPVQPTWSPPPIQPVPKLLAERGVQ